MYEISNELKQALSAPGREIKATVDLVTWNNGTETVTKTYDGSTIIDFTVDESCSKDSTFTLGAVTSAKLTLKLRTADSIPQKQKLRVYITVNNITEKIPLGAYYTDSTKRQDSVLTVTAYDGLMLTETPFDGLMEYMGYSYPATLKDMVVAIANSVGFSYNSDIDNLIADITVSTEPKGFTCREILGFIASASKGNAHLDREGKFTVCSPSAVNNIGVSDYIKFTKSDEGETGITKLIVDTCDGNKYELGTDGNTLSIKNPFLNESMSSGIYNWLKDKKYVPCDIMWRGRIDLEPNDSICITDRNNVQTHSFIIDNQIKFNGGLSQTSKSKALTGQQSAYGGDYYSKAETVETAGSNILLIKCNEADLLDNIPEDTPEGTLVGTLEDISVINSKSMLRSIGTLYQYSKQYCTFNGAYIIGLNNDGQSQAEIILPSKYYDEKSMTVKTVNSIDFANNFLGSDMTAVYDKLRKLTVPKEITHPTIINLGQCPRLSELIIESEHFSGGTTYVFQDCPDLKTIRFTNLNSDEQTYPIGAMMGKSYVEQIYFNKEFVNKSSISPLFQNSYTEKIAFYGDNIGALYAGNINGCGSLKEVILGGGITAINPKSFINLTALEVVEVRSKMCSFNGDLDSDDYGIFKGCKSGFTIRCYKNTAAYIFAQSNGLGIELIEE